MFRFAFLALVLIGLVGIFGGAFGTAAAGVGAFVILPFLLFKLFFLVMIFGFFGRRAWGNGESYRWGPGRRFNRDDTPSREERFDEWHRMAHAKEEVDGWLEGWPDVDENPRG